MPTLMPELAREMAAFNRKAADFARASRLRLRGAQAARQLTRFTLYREGDARTVWQAALEAFEEGLTAEESAAVLQTVRDVADTWLDLAREAREFWGEVAATEAAPEGLEELSRAEAGVSGVKAAAERMHAFLSRPRPPLDLERLRAGLAEAEQRRVKTAAQMRERFQGPEA